MLAAQQTHAGAGYHPPGTGTDRAPTRIGCPGPSPSLGSQLCIVVQPSRVCIGFGIPCCCSHAHPRLRVSPRHASASIHVTATAPKWLGSISSPSCFARTICIWEARGGGHMATSISYACPLLPESRPAGKPCARTRSGSDSFISSVEIKTLVEVFTQASGISKCSKIYGLNN